MDKQQAIHLVRQTFESRFEENKFKGFIKNLLNQYEVAEFSRTGNYIPDSFKNYVTRYERLGKYEDEDGQRMDILVVYLERATSLDHARTMQRNFVAGYLQGKYGSNSQKDAALVAFVPPDSGDWRFSLVKLDVQLEAAAKGGMKPVDVLTPARRWSFLVGSQEKSHTAQRQFAPIIEDDLHNPSLARLEEAFNIEKVTKEFFEKYRELFIRTKEELDNAVNNNPKIKADFEGKEIDTVNFAKKLLGQIIFLYYLQKKGWFGVPRDALWGEGSRNFLRELFEKRHSGYENFFNDILEPLFYEALRIDRSHDDHYYKLFNCKIPFLNGGLFDPMNNYDWVKTDILISNELFSNKNKTKEGDVGDGILDIFDRYNFTVKEDEPFEKEVAIDPELLGKAYEKFNAIRPDNYEEYRKALKSGKKGEEIKFNRQYGVYYTPREIVHYMCQQSLINYLYSELNSEVSCHKLDDNRLDLFGNAAKSGQPDMSVEHCSMAEISKEHIETLILRGEEIKEHDARVVAEGRETKKYPFLMPEPIRQNSPLIDAILTAIKVCDPAVGSGAFPVGMMSEIVKARHVLETYTKASKTMYDFKRECIETSLYGVDIDAGAVEIAKLRLWLSLVVDEDDPQNIKPLPNLDYKIVCGNSLIGFPFKSQRLNKIEQLKKQFFYETRYATKIILKETIDQLLREAFASSTKSLGYAVNFDFEIYFSEVFHEKGGFDVVIGNPPYLESRHPDFSNELKKLYQASTKKRWSVDAIFVTRGSDLLIYFFENAIFNVNRNGCIAFITQNSWLDTEYGRKFQEFLLKNTQVRLVLDSDFRYFSSGDGPNINTVITLFVGKKSVPSNTVTFARYHENFNRVANIIDYENSPFIETHKYLYTDDMLKQVKWGILLSSSEETLALLEILKQKAAKIKDIRGYRLLFGQGLNLSKDYILNKKTIDNFPFTRRAAIPLLTSNDGAIFDVVSTSQYILDKTKLTIQEMQELKGNGINPFDPNSTSKRPPKLVMPRGISRHFCAYNSLNCYSSSFVDVYDIDNNADEKVILNLWLFFNSSLFWLLREISGRKNLGGGMLKAEAVDLEPMPVYMDFQRTREIKEILQIISKRQAFVTIEEIDSDEHKQIDNMVFEYLDLNENESKHIVLTLKQKITDREKKATT